jgi:hypothetical protein
MILGLLWKLQNKKMNFDTFPKKSTFDEKNVNKRFFKKSNFATFIIHQ